MSISQLKKIPMQYVTLFAFALLVVMPEMSNAGTGGAFLQGAVDWLTDALEGNFAVLAGLFAVAIGAFGAATGKYILMAASIVTVAFVTLAPAAINSMVTATI